MKQRTENGGRKTEDGSRKSEVGSRKAGDQTVLRPPSSVFRPILFSGAMVRAILEGRKTQTRRVVKEFDQHNLYEGKAIPCPYGQTGDRLWVRETWAQTESDSGPIVAYQAGGTMMNGANEDEEDEIFPGECGQIYPPDRWRPSIFMPRWASRITLEITGIRIERVQAISEADVEAEGLRKEGMLWAWPGYPSGSTNPLYAYELLWDIINEKRGFGWDANPWVWVVEFRRTEDGGRKP